MLLLWDGDGNGTHAPLYSGMWQALWKELQELLKRGHLPCCGSASSSASLHPFQRLLSARFSIPGRASRPARMAQQGGATNIHAGTSGCQRPCILPGASAISDSLHPSQRLSETCQPVQGTEPVIRSPSSPGITAFNNTGASLTFDVARESPEVQMGAQPDAGEPAQEKLLGQHVCWSQQRSPHSGQDSQDALLVLPAGNSPSLQVETNLQTPRRFLHLQGAAPRQSSSAMKGFIAAGQKRQRQELYQLGPQLGSGGFSTVFSGIRLSDGSPVAIKRVARESVLEWVELCQHLIRWCLAKHPADRPELEEILCHPWVRGQRF
ncbi:hypothetical protein DV515_00017963 [Chloebia gouldiae]|uniref:non-specific serine/threonine protein kinase n=1 Tax=Chloebia gouldiae TaxID=44316 RepID=A0A3L8Q937_CHLGU|nr:hypothetical protein DV515_00017963 [Chloebia gouldiae]